MAEFESVLKRDFMIKRSLMKGILKTENFRGRWFLLTLHFLRYCDGSIESGPDKTKGEIELLKVMAVETVDTNAFDKPNCFQILYKPSDSEEPLVLYIQAAFGDQRDGWIKGIRDNCEDIGVRMIDKYHPGAYKSGKYTCCSNSNRLSGGCHKTTSSRLDVDDTNITSKSKELIKQKSPDEIERNSQGQGQRQDQGQSRGQSEGHLQEQSKNESILSPRPQLDEQTSNRIPVPRPRNKVVSSCKKALALYDYAALESGDLSLKKGEEYEILDNDKPHWWKARSKSGDVGFIPANYIQIISGNENGSDQELRKYAWFYADVSLTQAEEILKRESKAGCFIVRNSRKVGFYSLSFLIILSSGEANLKHYHIKTNALGQFFITESQTFNTLPELIAFHQKNTGALVSQLGSPPKENVRNSILPTTAGLGHEMKEILLSELKILDEVGSGHFGKVFHGIYKGSVEVAIKMVRPNCMSESAFRAEAETMAKLHHKNLVQLYGVCSDTSPLYLVTEYMRSGALLGYLRRNRHKIIDETAKLVDMSLQICEAMKYLESVGFIHRDLAARNCLVGENSIIKVADFGLARFVVDDEYTPSSTTKFPVKWSAPEVLLVQRFSSKSDVWSFGILMWEIFTAGEMPYNKLPTEELIKSICDMNKRLSQPPKCPETVFGIMLSCWAKDPKDRPTFSDIQKSLIRVST